MKSVEDLYKVDTSHLQNAEFEVKKIRDKSVKLINLIDFAMEKDVVKDSWRNQLRESLNILESLEYEVRKSLGSDFKPYNSHKGARSKEKRGLEITK